jgi:hypothetical protein
MKQIARNVIETSLQKYLWPSMSIAPKSCSPLQRRYPTGDQEDLHYR